MLRLFSDGKNSTEIARALETSLQTLRNHLRNVTKIWEHIAGFKPLCMPSIASLSDMPAPERNG